VQVILDEVTVPHDGEFGGEMACALGATTIDTNKNGVSNAKVKSARTLARRFWRGFLLNI
jgi:hypothetical protein